MPGSFALKDLIIISIFTALVFGTVESYTCTNCFLEECNENPGTCEASQGCLSIRQELNVSGQPSALTQAKSCASSDCTTLAFSATLGGERSFGYGRSCCQTEQCNKDNFYLSPKSSTPNGIECPACFNDKEASCNSVPLKCTGEENQCIEVTGTEIINGITQSVIYGKGCATKTACSLNMVVLEGVNIKTTCSGASSGIPPTTSIISSILTSLFLLTVLL